MHRWDLAQLHKCPFPEKAVWQISTYVTVSFHAETPGVFHKVNVSLQATDSRRPLRKQKEWSLSEIREGHVLYSGYKKLVLNHGERFYEKTPNDFLQTLLEDDSF